VMTTGATASFVCTTTDTLPPRRRSIDTFRLGIFTFGVFDFFFVFFAAAALAMGRALYHRLISVACL